MTISRRKVFQSLALVAGCSPAANAADPAVSLDVLRGVATANGTDFGDGRLRVDQPVLEHSLPELRKLRDFDLNDLVEPAQGILDK